VAKSDKDEFNFDDFEYSGVKLSPVPDLTQAAPAVEPVEPASLPEIASPSSAELVTAVEPEDKKAKKKAKKVKPVKIKKAVVADDAAAVEKTPSPFLKKLSEASPYTVLLGMAVVMLLLAVIFLFIELGRYDFNTKALVMNDSIAAPFDRTGSIEMT
jgi:hypothetical protein